MSRSDGSTADYYVLPEGATQLQDLISHRNMNAQIGEIFRAGYRYGMASHSDMLRDAKKIRFYAQAEVDRLEKLVKVEEPSHVVSDIPRIDIPQWKDAPEWANWLAQDKSGEWYWYEHPVEIEGDWWVERKGFDGYVDLAKCSGKLSNWEGTLKSRPTSTAQ